VLQFKESFVGFKESSRIVLGRIVPQVGGIDAPAQRELEEPCLFRSFAHQLMTQPELSPVFFEEGVYR
jgi:hypothetical protein